MGNPVPLPAESVVCVIDTSASDELATTATNRDLHIGDCIKQEAPDVTVICQTRAMPTIATKLAILDLPGHSGQQCETYAVLTRDGSKNFGTGGDADWESYAWALVRTERSADADDGGMDLDGQDKFRFCVARRWNQMADVFRNFFEQATTGLVLRPPGPKFFTPVKTVTYQAANCHWYQLVASRAFLYAARSRRLGLASLFCNSVDPVHLLARVEGYLGHTAETRPALQTLFEPRRSTRAQIHPNPKWNSSETWIILIRDILGSQQVHCTSRCLPSKAALTVETERPAAINVAAPQRIINFVLSDQAKSKLVDADGNLRAKNYSDFGRPLKKADSKLKPILKETE